MLIVIGIVTRPDLYGDPDWVWSNMLTILKLASVVGVVTVGMTFVIIGGGIDLSVGAIVALAGVWCTTVATQSYGAGGMIFTRAPRRASAVGLVNGVLISYGRLVPFIATLAMLVAARGLAAEISGKQTQVVQQHHHQRHRQHQAARHPAAGLHPGRWWSRPAGCCSTAPPSAGARSPSAATPRRPGWPASTSGGTPCCSTRCPGCAAASPRSC